ncbi:hypothetical protein SAPIO_CDS1297 [Scedosporium apiospermum]|uniref:C2H2-type domain-containing protein n=1 Tax=Pseudallescheria apiosperma TaxID=563466 RepID=A0A084GF03_PSEDA|nr:uncharacterized protein SAPIO_CDS1297 [Scedosporium apiospermum]KEZ45915.1 hypothetical protein SAPIO_CDS1297 [Scedosporium apiospermum]
MNPGLGWTIAPGAERLPPIDDSDPPQFESPTNAPQRSAQRATRRRKRYSLPLVIGNTDTIMACPDSGSDDNIISLDVATKLGLVIDSPQQDMRFSLANGKAVQAVGQVTTECSFPDCDIGWSCTFYVFSDLAMPAIVGLEFLDTAEVFSKNKVLLVEELVPTLQALRVHSIGPPKKGLICRVGKSVSCARVDSGSDLDLVSPEFVRAREFTVHPVREKLQFADGSIGFTSGVIEATFSVGDVGGVMEFLPRSEELSLQLHILESLTVDVLVGLDTIEELDIYGQHASSFIQRMPQPGESDLCVIRHIGSVERFVKNTFNSLIEDIYVQRQRENARQERSMLEAQTASIKHSGLSVTSGSASSEVGMFKCTFEGCQAKPFQTQYLLDSHANVHSSARPHHCPVQGCPRSKPGQGFRRKNEMIRHGLVHESPGYRCPFCPATIRHGYPRPDSLQRDKRVAILFAMLLGPCNISTLEGMAV